MATARLMETWAHGLDVADALGVRRPATARLRSIAHIGVRHRDFAFAINGAEPPTAPFRVELRAPGGDTWAWGSGGRRPTRHRLRRGLLPAGHTAPPSAQLDVLADGPDAERWLAIAQAFAGLPGPVAADRPRDRVVRYSRRAGSLARMIGGVPLCGSGCGREEMGCEHWEHRHRRRRRAHPATGVLPVRRVPLLRPR